MSQHFSDSSVVQQNFQSAVGNVAGRDIIQNNITTVQLLNALDRAVRQSRSIPESQKPTLLHQIRSLIENPYIVGLTTSAIFEGLKALITHGQ